MTVQEINGEGYTVEYNDGTHAVQLMGTIRLQTTDEYAPLTQLLQKAHDDTGAADTLRLDFRQLQFLNSSGINMISKFVIAARKQNKINLVILGNQEIYWQKKSLSNLQKLWPKIQIDIQ
ncbi:MAG: hypothetical protein JXA33_12700 [Anaerolineae bacterium]|nr:hypothetical protein [Anaerolineae bacterium]